MRFALNAMENAFWKNISIIASYNSYNQHFLWKFDKFAYIQCDSLFALCGKTTEKREERGLQCEKRKRKRKRRRYVKTERNWRRETGERNNQKTKGGGGQRERERVGEKHLEQLKLCGKATQFLANRNSFRYAFDNLPTEEEI